MIENQKKKLNKEKLKLFKKVDKFREIKSYQRKIGGLSTEDLILREVLELRFELQDLKNSNR